MIEINKIMFFVENDKLWINYTIGLWIKAIPLFSFI